MIIIGALNSNYRKRIIYLILSLYAAFWGCLAAAGALASPAWVSENDSIRLGARVIVVSNLNDKGQGSLREAIGMTGPRIILFSVAGVIKLGSDIDIVEPKLSIFGQTAPDPGIVIVGGSVHIRTHHVLMEHVGIFSGSAGKPEIDVARDSVSIIGLANKKAQAQYITLRNVSIGWAPDENMSIVGERAGSVLLTYSILAEGLARSAHPKADHSAALLIGPNARDITIYRNILATNQFRNPQIQAGSSVIFANNIVANPGRSLMFLDGERDAKRAQPIHLSALSNLVIPSKATNCGIYFIGFVKKRLPAFAGSDIKLSGNRVDDAGSDACYGSLEQIQPGAGNALLADHSAGQSGLDLVAAKELERLLLPTAGMRPARRSAVDARIVAAIRDRRATSFEADRSFADFRAPQPIYSVASIPEGWAPDVVVPKFVESAADQDRLEAYLCLRHKLVGGLQHGSCTAD